jgi:hypothetical protein
MPSGVAPLILIDQDDGKGAVARDLFGAVTLGLSGAVVTLADGSQRSVPDALIGKLDATGDASAAKVIAKGGVVSRTLADLASDANEAANYGAAPVSSDITTALGAALAQIPSTAPSGNTPVFVRLGKSGFYAVNSAWTPPSTRPVVLEAGHGVNYGGSLGFAGLKYDAYFGHEKTTRSNVPVTDTRRFGDFGQTGWLTNAGWEQTTNRESHVLKWSTGAGSQSAYTEIGHGVYALVPDMSLSLPNPEDSTQFFEKDAIAGYVRTEAGNSSQAVGVRGQGDIATPATNAAGNPSRGIAWGGDFVARVLPGSEGYSIGVEINNENNGPVQKQIGGYDKIGLKIVPAFTGNNITAGIYLSGNGTRGYYTGLWADQTSLVNDPLTRFIKLPSLFEVMRDGTTMIGKTTPDATARGTGIQFNPNGTMSLANYAGNPVFEFDGQVNSQRGIRWRAGGTTAWEWFTNFDSSSDLVLNAFDASGNFASTPLILSRSTGKATFKAINTGAPVTPASATASGTQGDWSYDSGFVYLCIAANTWKRVMLSSW